MPITPEQKDQAEERQWIAARDSAPQVRLVAGPGTGKSRTIEKRVADLLEMGADPHRIRVISFTRAACAELLPRIRVFCKDCGCNTAASVRVSTMHSLALSILRRAHLLHSYPSNPVLLDQWEEKNVYDAELSLYLRCSRTRAAQIRLAHDAQWQTLSPAHIAQAEITPEEIQGFGAYHASRTNLYSCVLPGELIFKCVHALQTGALEADELPEIDHLIVDEFQDLNACDQEFIRLLCAQGATLFVAGDDDQSIYSFRHANPDGIVVFPATYPLSSTHILTDCFRCTPAVLEPATRLISHNPNRVDKDLQALYGEAEPPVNGRLFIWAFQSAWQEAQAIAGSCERLLAAGMSGREDDIVILISNRRLQVDLLVRALRERELPYEAPRGKALAHEYLPIRAVYALLRVLADNQNGEPDYPAYRDLLQVLTSVGDATAKVVGDCCIAHQQNFRNLFYLADSPEWLSNRALSAVERVRAVVQSASSWQLADTLGARIEDIRELVQSHILVSGKEAATFGERWDRFCTQIPQDMTIEELLQLLAADSEIAQQAVLDAVAERLGAGQVEPDGAQQRRVRMMTMHGAKGLSGKVVFIPSAEQNVMPNAKALNATGLLIEQRRLFYVSVTRAMACCVISHARQHSLAGAKALGLKENRPFRRSQFLDEMDIGSSRRTAGLTAEEADDIVRDVDAL